MNNKRNKIYCCANDDDKQYHLKRIKMIFSPTSNVFSSFHSNCSSSINGCTKFFSLSFSLSLVNKSMLLCVQNFSLVKPLLLNVCYAPERGGGGAEGITCRMMWVDVVIV